MPVAHACISCGTSLSRVRARVDPHYGLRIVVCPGCGTACVRRRHPLPEGWRRFRSVQSAVRHLVFTIAATGAFLAGSIFGAALTLDLLRALGTSWTRLHGDVISGRAAGWTIPYWMRGSGEPFSPIVLVLFSFLAGLVLAFALTHWRRWLLVLAWVALWNVVVLTPLLTHEFGLLVDTACASVLGEGSLFRQSRSSPNFNGTYDLAAASMYSIGPFVLGILGASLARGLAGMNARRRWIKRRRALKRRRESR